MINWQWKLFDELTNTQLYDLLKLRQEVFVIEQKCLYDDLDGADNQALHLLGYSAGQQLIAYLRIFEPGTNHQYSSIGRVVINKNNRGAGLGTKLIMEAIKKLRLNHPSHAVRISAQHYLQEFYTELGFEVIGEAYLEDGIEHIQMILSSES